MAEFMMEVPLADGHSVFVEVDDHEVDGHEVPGELVLAGKQDKQCGVAVRATETLEQTLGKMKPVLHTLGDWARSAGPDECCVEFGLKLGGEMGVIVAKGTTEVHFIVKLTWTK